MDMKSFAMVCQRQKNFPPNKLNCIFIAKKLTAIGSFEPDTFSISFQDLFNATSYDMEILPITYFIPII